jgi:cation diffusion facilitator family transporter
LSLDPSGSAQRTAGGDRSADRACAIGILGNVILAVFKLFAGVTAHSSAMISDAAHTVSDIFSTLIVSIGIRLAGRASDKDHPYGHERLESVAAILLAVILTVTGIGIGWEGLKRIFGGGLLPIPGALALIAAGISIAVKEGMFWYTRAAALRTDSSALMANAWHHRSDALSSIGSFAGILGARLGVPLLDPIASVLLCLLIVKTGITIFMDAVGQMTDRAWDDGGVEAIRAVILEEPDILGVDVIKTRRFGSRIYVDIEICADGNASLREGHAIAQWVHDAIETRFPKVKHCMVHVNPK